MQRLRHDAVYEKRGAVSVETGKSDRVGRRYHFDFLIRVLLVTMHRDCETHQGDVTSQTTLVQLAVGFSGSLVICSIKVV